MFQSFLKVLLQNFMETMTYECKQKLADNLLMNTIIVVVYCILHYFPFTMSLL